MKRMLLSVLVLAAVVPAAPGALAQQSITYGRVTAVEQVPVENARSRTGGAIVGGTIGVMTGSGKSGSNKALRGVVGANVGGRVGAGTGRQFANEYTVLVDRTSTVRIITDDLGIRIGDCVALERGSFNNVRLVPEERCAANAERPASDVAEANTCAAAKQAVRDSKTDAEFDRAERRMRAVCN